MIDFNHEGYNLEENKQEICERKKMSCLPAGSVGYQNDVPDAPNYFVEVEAYPTIKPLTLNRNVDNLRHGISPTDTGVKILSTGDYMVSFTIIVSAEDTEDTGSASLVVLTSIDGKLQTNSADLIGTTQTTIATMDAAAQPWLTSLDVTGYLRLKKGQCLSVVVAHPGYPEIIPIYVWGWNISLHKICDRCPKQSWFAWFASACCAKIEDHKKKPTDTTDLNVMPVAMFNP